MTKTVVYISSCALHADGKPDPFFLQELPWLRRHFDRVIVCAGTGVAQIDTDRPETIAVSRPAFGTVRALLKAPVSGHLWSELTRMRADGKLNAANILKLLFFTVRGLKMHYWMMSLLNAQEQTTLYSYWMSFDGYAAALVKRKNPAMRAIARAHAFDIDLQRNPMNPYLMKRFILQTLDALYPISKYALNQLQAYAAVPAEKTFVIGAGSAGEAAEHPFSTPRFQDGVLHLVSCATIIEVKQVPLLIDALAQWQDGEVEWTHIGGGQDEDKVHAYAREKLGDKRLIRYTFTGRMQPEQIRALYETQPFDVFINTSINEGIPVTMMEALHAGIPVIGPRVGGIPELVDDEVGALYAPQGGAAAVVEALQTMQNQTAQEAETMRNAALARWKERCDLETLLPLLFPLEAGEAQPQ